MKLKKHIMKSSEKQIITFLILILLLFGAIGYSSYQIGTVKGLNEGWELGLEVGEKTGINYGTTCLNICLERTTKQDLIGCYNNCANNWYYRERKENV